ncbi:protein-disulfide reductase DsbD family protein [Allosphingosinicella sp.]|jgi:thiol:disulfide interchange protein|uniref:protein-disulfide reductase DsbD family protein n=1 Tax=Allosphingosinicella sp. TaxID=2823234 RepID=UPI002F11B7F8
MTLWRLLLSALALLSCAPAMAQPQRAMTVELLPEGRTVAPGGTITLAFVMKPEPGWHGYWLNPADAGRPDTVEWSLPAGVAAGPLRYPVPGRLMISGLMNYVYERDYALLAEVRVPANSAPGSLLPVAAKLDFLACTDTICVPQQARVSTELRVGAERTTENRAAIDRFRQALPRPLAGEAAFEISGGRLRLAVPLPAGAALDDPYFFPATLDAIAYSARQSLSRSGDTLIVETQAAPRADTLQTLAGVLALGDGSGLELAARRGRVPAAGAPVNRPAVQRDTPGEILYALIGALIGGLLLNVMPCVFPILSLKALSLARTGGDERSARREALAYSAGVIAVCLLLGAAVLGVRSAGVAVGWAFQLQDPRVILLLLLLVTAIALGLAGLFRLPAFTGGGRLAGRTGTTGAFWTGALAAFVATPCTGPFMGAALGAALVLPTIGAMAVFGGLGLGLAIPFLALGFIPALRRRLPRPGPWMERFQRILSVPMFLTAIGLAWVLGRQAGVDGMTIGLCAVLALGLALWWLGRRQGRGWPALVLAAAAIATALFLVRTQTPAETGPRGALAAEPFSEPRLASLRAQGRPVFVYFTADWCLTCKVNERVVLERADVAESFRTRGVAVLVGDWTRGEPEIGRFLESHGRSGVPLYLWYAPGREAEILPQILTVGRMKALAS